MKKNKLIVGAVALGLGLASFGAGADAKGKPSDPGAGGRCVSQGLQTLAALGATSAAARGEVDYSAFADPEDGPIFLDLDEGSFIPLPDVIALHRSNPELFAWCG